eukprot:TRINITY_DN8456_c0_g1_i4.p1 TRINITY_DN8456_c0_g1~~TRINITY_DN8456_c0_g1_i4.p1  ORF type:complete len:737 (-),score=150.98 TRINITY_DN8456_c0_g1_i4:285-2495(-)
MHKEFSPFVLLGGYSSHSDRITCLDWSSDSKYILTGSRDCTVKLHSIFPRKKPPRQFDSMGYPMGRHPFTMSGHRDVVMLCTFNKDQTRIYTVSKKGVLLVWKLVGDEEKHWVFHEKHYFDKQSPVSALKFHKQSGLLVVGFSKGFFGLWELPTFTEIQMLSMSSHKIKSVAINPTGEWLAFGVPEFGQLLVWEWQSERYVFKQQGHLQEMSCLAYGPNGRYLATGGRDSKVKIWKTDDGFCFVTFTEHSGPITGITFGGAKQVVLSSSLDGTVRAFDLIRYRNFRIFTSPTPRQFSCVALDSSGEIVAAGCMDTFEIYIWDMQTGRLLDILQGHEAPISKLSFSSHVGHLASSSWDHTVKIWDVFSGNKTCKENFQHNTDVLCVVYRPDGQQLATSSLDGVIQFWDPQNDIQVGFIDGRNDLRGGVLSGGARSAKTTSRGKYFTSLCYTADGTCLLAGGESKYVCIYEVKNRILLKRFQISYNRSLDGMFEYQDGRKITSYGHLTEFDLEEEPIDPTEQIWERRTKNTLPGVMLGPASGKKETIKISEVTFSPSGRQWACCSTTGLVVFSLDEQILFDPYQLDLDVTSVNIHKTLMDGLYLKALVMALRLNEFDITLKVFETIPHESIEIIARDLHRSYLKHFLTFIARYMSTPTPLWGTVSPHVHFTMKWISAILFSHGQFLKDNPGQFSTSFRALQKNILQVQEVLDQVCTNNSAIMSYLGNAQKKERFDFSQ